MEDAATLKVFKRQNMLTVGQVCREIPGKNGGHCSRQHIYNLINQGELTPAFRFGRKQGICVPREVVEAYKLSCLIDPYQ